MTVDLAKFDNSRFPRGRPRLVEAAWIALDALFVRSRLPGSAHRRWLLRLFGAGIGEGVVIKPGARIKFPWRLTIGSHTWIGEEAWLDNLDRLEIGANCCVSQGAYLCTGSHDWSSPAFDLVTKPIKIGDGAWIAARAVVGPGVVVGEGAVLALGAVATENLQPWSVYAGTPARFVRRRTVDEEGARGQPDAVDPSVGPRHVS